MRARSRGALALALTALWPNAAEADGAPRETRVLLEWSRGPGAESCMSPEEAAKDVERLLARPVFAPPNEADRRLVVSIERTKEPRGYRASMKLFAASGAPLGSREIAIEAERCDQATEAITLALAIMADLPRTPEESLPPPKEREARPLRHLAPVSPANPPRRSPPSRLELGLGPAVAMATSSTVAPGVHATALFEPTKFVPLLAGVISTARAYETVESRRVWLVSTGLEAALCLPPLDWRALTFFGCLGPEVTIHVGWGAGFGEDRSGLASAFGGVARAYGRYALSSKVQLFATIAVSATPQTLEIVFTDRSGARRTAFETSTVVPSSSIGAAFDIF